MPFDFNEDTFIAMGTFLRKVAPLMRNNTRGSNCILTLDFTLVAAKFREEDIGQLLKSFGIDESEYEPGEIVKKLAEVFNRTGGLDSTYHVEEELGKERQIIKFVGEGALTYLAYIDVKFDGYEDYTLEGKQEREWEL